MAKTEFKVGDRVAIFGSVIVEKGLPLHINCNKGIGTVTHAEGTCVWIKLIRSGLVGPSHPDQWKDTAVIAHPKQCRRLVKRERRRVWIPEKYFDPSNKRIQFADGLGDYSPGWTIARRTLRPLEVSSDWIEFVEVRRPKK